MFPQLFSVSIFKKLSKQCTLYFISDQYINNLYQTKHKINAEGLFKTQFDNIVYSFPYHFDTCMTSYFNWRETMKVQSNTTN